MDLTWIDPEHLDDRDVDGALALITAANAVDWTDAAPYARTDLIADVRHGWDGDPAKFGLFRDKRNRVVGVLEVGYSHWDNAHLGFLEVTIDPATRGQGLGRRLLEIGIDRVRAEGKSVVLTESLDTPAANALAGALGFERAMVEVKRRQDLLALDWTALDREQSAAATVAADYELLRLAGPTPDGLVDEVVRMSAAINDAPIDDLQVEDEKFSPERLRAFERGQLEHSRRVYRVVARSRATGELAGHTMVGVLEAHPGYGGQYDTSVVRSHRGHRLGLLLKIEMLRWLSDTEPQLRCLDTWNAATNDHMVGVNEVLGYQVIAQALAWQRQV